MKLNRIISLWPPFGTIVIVVTGGPYSPQLPLSIGESVGAAPAASGGTAPYTWSIVTQTQT